MKLIKIFLASSEEMDYDRMVFGNLVRRLNDLYERRGVRLKLFEWEDYDSAFNDQRKQDEYNERVRESDVFLALFHKKAGAFTVEEFDVATETFREKASPKVYTFLKDLKPGEEASPELEEFKRRLFEEMGHYWCRYDNRDSLQFQFVMQLQLVENNMDESLTVDDGVVRIDGIKVASMDQLKFAAGNEDYVKTSEELAALPAKIEKARLRAEKFPDDEDLAEDLQQKLDRYNKLKEEFADYQKILFETAKRVARLQGERITDRMRRAMDAFNDGKVREANIILDEAEADATRNLEDFKQSREITEQKRQTVICSLEELLLKASTMMADAGIPIEERIDQVDKIYAQADEMAEVIGYDENKHAQFLNKYGFFLVEYSRPNQALRILDKAKEIREKVLGSQHPDTALIYNNIGAVYSDLGQYSKAIEYHEKAAVIRERVLEADHPDLAFSYNNIGVAYYHQGEYTKALDYYKKALIIRENGHDVSLIAETCSNIGVVYSDMGDYSKAIEYHEKAVVLREKTLGEEHSDTALSYNNIGSVYYYLRDYSKALQYYQKALMIREKTLGVNHLDTAFTYSNIGCIYNTTSNGDYSKALMYSKKALMIREKVLGRIHPDTAVSYNNVGSVYCRQGKYHEALEYYKKALAILKQVLGENHPYTAMSYDAIGGAYYFLEDYSHSLEYHSKALEIRKDILGDSHPDNARTYNSIGAIYEQMGELDKALEYREKGLEIMEKALGPDHADALMIKEKIAALRHRLQP